MRRVSFTGRTRPLAFCTASAVAACSTSTLARPRECVIRAERRRSRGRPFDHLVVRVLHHGEPDREIPRTVERFAAHRDFGVADLRCASRRRQHEQQQGSDRLHSTVQNLWHRAHRISRCVRLGAGFGMPVWGAMPHLAVADREPHCGIPARAQQRYWSAAARLTTARVPTARLVAIAGIRTATADCQYRRGSRSTPQSWWAINGGGQARSRPETHRRDEPSARVVARPRTGRVASPILSRALRRAMSGSRSGA